MSVQVAAAHISVRFTDLARTIATCRTPSAQAPHAPPQLRPSCLLCTVSAHVAAAHIMSGPQTRLVQSLPAAHCLISTGATGSTAVYVGLFPFCTVSAGRNCTPCRVHRPTHNHHPPHTLPHQHRHHRFHRSLCPVPVSTTGAP